jgi:hypothetical protein
VIEGSGDVKALVGGLDSELNFRTYGVVSVPVVCDGEIKWVIMIANSLSSDGKFDIGEVGAVKEYGSILSLAMDIRYLKDRLEEVNVSIQLWEKLSPRLDSFAPGTVPASLRTIANYFRASRCALYEFDAIGNTLGLIDANFEAPPNLVVSQGIVVNVLNTGEAVISGNIQSLPDFKLTMDSFGDDRFNSGVYVRISSCLILVLLAEEKDAFTALHMRSLLMFGPLISHFFTTSRNLSLSTPDISRAVSGELRGQYLNQSANPSKSDLEEIGDRVFNIMRYDDDAKVVMILKMFVAQGFVRKLQITFSKLVNFLCTLKSVYNDVPYHNWTLACDCTQFIFSCIVRGRFRLYLQELELFAILLASISHCVDHKGLNNEFHRKARTGLGVLYAGGSIMEQHHAAVALNILEMPENDVLEGVETQAERRRFFEVFVNVILALDMDKHIQFLKDFEGISLEFDKRNDKHRLLLAQILMKAGAIAYTVRPFEVSSQFAQCIVNEQFDQGDKEKEIGVEVTQGYDRGTAGHISLGQVSFHGLVAQPLMVALGNFVPALADNVEQLEKNKKMWENQKANWDQT